MTEILDFTITAEAGEEGIIKGMAMPYNKVGFPKIMNSEQGAGNLVFMPGSLTAESGIPLVINSELPFTITHKHPEGLAPLAVLDKNLTFKDSPEGLMFEAKLDLDDQNSKTIYDALKDGKIKGHVSVGAKITEYVTGSAIVKTGDTESQMDLKYVSEGYLDHLAFLGNIEPAFEGATSIAAEQVELINKQLQEIQVDVLELLGYVDKEGSTIEAASTTNTEVTITFKSSDVHKIEINAETQSEQSTESVLDLLEEEREASSSVDQDRVDAALALQNKINWERGKPLITISEGD